MKSSFSFFPFFFFNLDVILKSSFRFSFETFYYRYETTLKSFLEMVLDDIENENIKSDLYFVFSNLKIKVLKLQIKISLSKLSLQKNKKLQL